MELPVVFQFPVRPDLVRRAYISAFTARLQPKGTDPEAGKKHSCMSYGVGLGLARIPRHKGHLFPRGCFAPNTVGGRRAHPPRPEKRLHEEINRKERRLALASAIAATAYRDLVAARGHRVDQVPSLPLVVVDDLEGITKARELRGVFKALGLWPDIKRAKERIRVRAGKGKRRGRRLKKPKSVLIVVSRKDAPVIDVADNFPGVDAVYVDMLSVLHLAPGGVPGRLTLWTRSAIEALAARRWL